MNSAQDNFRRWFRRLVCLFGGGALGYVLVFVGGITSSVHTEEALTWLLWVSSPLGAMTAGAIFLLVVLWVERREAKRKVQP